MWSRLDDGFTWNKKVLRAGNEAAGAFARMVSHCSHQRSDGYVDEATAIAIAGRRKVLDTMVTVGLLDREGVDFRVHNYLKYNPSRAELDAKRSAKTERQERWRKTYSRDVVSAQNAGKSTRVDASTDASQDTSTDASRSASRDASTDAAPSHPIPSHPKKERRDTSKTGRTHSTQGTAPLALAETTTAADAATSASAGGRLVRELFEHWQSVHKHPTAKLDDRRRRAIERAIKSHGAETVRAAISGCAKSAFHKGDNDRGAVYDDLTLILRDASKIEHFAALEAQQGTQRVVVLPKGVPAVRTPVPVPQAPERPMSFAALRELRQKSEREAFAKEVEAAQSAPVAAWGES